ncbi:hypothetical protein AHAS_Ahas07G0142300 [Arachis hypogaea]
MYASKSRDLIFVFKSLLLEEIVYIFAYFRVNNNYKLYCRIIHPFKLFFEAKTIVRHSIYDTISLSGIKLVSFLTSIYVIHIIVYK